MSYYLETPEGLYLTIKVHPRASSNVLKLDANNALNARVTAPPVESAANHAVIELLARYAGTAKSRIKLKSGEKSRVKRFLIEGSAPQLIQALQTSLKNE